ncbi:MAG: S1 RNA-binding domain-containing protein, partial [Thermodesulfovibrionales bacterium]|nr:S1 RNA-binding domain-containing protein [Thermodesulfovibrionales bacterium]
MSLLEDRQDSSISEESFNAMLERSLQSPSYFSAGEKIIAQIVSITPESVFINLGGKKEGFINTAEFLDENNQLSLKIGDEIEAFFEKVEDGLMKFTTLINGLPASTLKYLKEVADKGDAIEGKVDRQNKGGFEVLIKGVRAFCPVSQIDLKPSNDKSMYEGKTFAFKIIDFKENGKGIIVSRKVLLEEEKKARIEALKGKIKEGEILEGTVKSIKNFGIFVDLDGIVALIPSSEVSWTRNQNLNSLFTEGQSVKAVVLSADIDAEKVTMSIKSLYEDPWLKIEDKYPVGTKVSGNVSKFMPFGAFVNIEDGIEGLIHISNLNAGRRLKHPDEVLTLGQLVEAYVLSIDKENRKLSLSLKSPEKLEIEYPSVGDIIYVTVSRLMPFGVLAKINDGLTGLIPNAETGLAKGEDMKSTFIEGKTVKVVVQE